MEGCQLSQVVKRVSEEKHGFAASIAKNTKPELRSAFCKYLTNRPDFSEMSSDEIMVPSGYTAILDVPS